ncbi:MAG: hypothetical protein RI963_2459 [Planctomycetota bacterium]
MTTARDQNPQLGSQPQAGSAQPQAGASQPKQLFLLNSFDRKPGFLMPQPLSQAGASQPQAGSRPQAGSQAGAQGASTPQAGSAQPLSQAACLPSLHFAKSFESRPGFLMPQPLSQAGASQPQAGSRPQAGSQAGAQGASTPQAGSAQPLSQPPLHNRPPNRPAEAFAEVNTAKAAASTREETTRRIVGTPKGLGTDLVIEPQRFPAKTNPQCQGRSGRRSSAALSVKLMAEVVG